MKQSVSLAKFRLLSITLGLAFCFDRTTVANDNLNLAEHSQNYLNRIEAGVYRDSVRPNWLPDSSQFWYKVKIAKGTSEFVLVDPMIGTVARNAKAAELGIQTSDRIQTSTANPSTRKRSRWTGAPTQFQLRNQFEDSVDIFWADPDGTNQPYGRLLPGESKEFSTYEGHVWVLQDSKGDLLGRFEASEKSLEISIDGKPNSSDPSLPNLSTAPSENSELKNRSPDGKWGIRFRRNNIDLLSLDLPDSSDSKLVVDPLTQDGNETTGFRGPVAWSPDSQYCVVRYVTEAPKREVVVVDSSPRDQLQPKLLRYNYFKPGDVLPTVQPVLIDVATKSATVIDSLLFANHYTEDGMLYGNWSSEGDEYFFDFNQRGHQLYRILALSPKSKEVRVVAEEQSKTTIEYNEKTWRHWIESTGELLWMSERDGWAHLWLIDVASGKTKNQVTRGEWVVREVLKVDQQLRQVWFMAGGVHPGADPYYRHLCRVDLDGNNFVCLTQGDGDHKIEFSPNQEYFLDRWSRVDQPTVTELRKSHDGSLICELERGDATELIDAGWTVPERFVAKGRDGKTDIYGILIKPSHFDPQKKYPIVEQVYAGPHGSFTPKQFGKLAREHTLAELGFIVVQSDGMGTDDRGKVFHDVSWKNLADAGFPDRIAWIRAAAAERPWMDLSRVGIYGGSAGGQNAMRALIDHHDFYHVAVADCGCHDNRMDKIWWNEQWLGWPLDDSYVRSSNVEHASRMQGKLLLVVGELDTNVDPASTMQVVSALQKANKNFDFLPIVGAGHGAAESPYGNLRRMEFLKRHLLEN